MHRSSSPVRIALLVVAIALAAGITTCREPSDPDGNGQTGPPTDPRGDEPAPGAGPIEPLPTPEEIRGAREEKRVEWDRAARGYIASFESRVYQPFRDSGLQVAEGRIEAECNGTTARYGLRFDGTRKPGERVIVTPVEVPEAMPEGTTDLVRRWAVHSLAGASESVLYYRPPIQYLLVPPSKGGPGIVVHCPPHRGEVGVSYRFDERELVTIRGATSPTAREITYFDWEHFSSRYLLRGMTFHGTESSVEFAHSDHDGVLLLDAVAFDKDDISLTARFTYDRIVATGPPPR